MLSRAVLIYGLPEKDYNFPNRKFCFVSRLDNDAFVTHLFLVADAHTIENALSNTRCVREAACMNRDLEAKVVTEQRE